MKRYFLFDDEHISGTTYVLRLLISVFLLVTIIGGIWLMASTAFKRARSLGWGKNYACAILIPIHMSVPTWPESVFELYFINLITIPLWLLQLTLVFKNSVKSNSESTYGLGKITANKIGKFINTSFNLKVFTMIILSILLLKPILHFSFFPEKSMELDTENKTYVDGYAYTHKVGYFKGPKGLEPAECVYGKKGFEEFGEWWEETDCTRLYRTINLQSENQYHLGKYYGVFTEKGERYRIEKDANLDMYGNPTTVYYYPFKDLDLISHFEIIFKSKLWIFVISFVFTLFLVYMFRYKISSKP